MLSNTTQSQISRNFRYRRNWKNDWIWLDWNWIILVWLLIGLFVSTRNTTQDAVNASDFETVPVHPAYLDDAYEGELLVLFVDLLGAARWSFWGRKKHPFFDSKDLSKEKVHLNLESWLVVWNMYFMVRFGDDQRQFDKHLFQWKQSTNQQRVAQDWSSYPNNGKEERNKMWERTNSDCCLVVL